VARITASGLASRVGFSLDEVDDLRLALDELCFTAIGRGLDNEELELRYSTSARTLSINGATLSAANGRPTVGEFSQQILTALVDEHRVWDDNGKNCFSLVKRSPAKPKNRTS